MGAPVDRMIDDRSSMEGEMPSYDSVVDRTRFYAETSGLSQSKIATYRRTPVADWTRRADRRIGSAIRGPEALWADPDVTVGFWRQTATRTLRAVHDFVDEVITTVKALAERIADGVESAIKWFLRTSKRAEEWINLHPRIKGILEGLLVLAAAALDVWLVKLGLA